jgi:hypothetical protein
MNWRQAQEVALGASLLAVLLLLYEHISYYIRHWAG